MAEGKASYLLMIWVLEIVQVTLPSEREQDLKTVRGAKNFSRIYRTRLAASRLSGRKV